MPVVWKFYQPTRIGLVLTARDGRPVHCHPPILGENFWRFNKKRYSVPNLLHVAIKRAEAACFGANSRIREQVSLRNFASKAAKGQNILNISG
jgi:hypothetical protein